MYVRFIWQGRCFAMANAVVVVVVILCSRSEHWLNNFRVLPNDDDYPFFFFSDDKAIMIELCSLCFSFFLLSFFILSFSVFLHLITIAVFIHSLGLPPTSLCRNIKTSSSSLLLSFRRPLKKKFERIYRQ